MLDFIDIKKFTKKSQIGKGSSASVFKVTDDSSGEIYAAKISLNELTEEQKSLIINTKREIDIITRLTHPSIVKFIGYSPTDFDNKYYPVIIMEYLTNGSLKNFIHLERQSISHPLWNDTKKLINIYGIASAMKFLHDHDIIHRDLKPDNILEDDNLYPKITDFGLSKILHTNAESITTQSTVGFKGTPIYAAPEIWERNEYTKATDVYAFSIIVYEILTLEEPFKNFNMMMTCRKVGIDGFRPEFKYPIDKCYRELITKCWSQDPEKRPSFDQIVDDLRNNEDFIIDTVDKDEYLEYIDMVDSLDISFKSVKKKIKTVALPSPTPKTVDLPSPTLKTVALPSPTLKTVALPSTTPKTVALPSPTTKTVNLPSPTLKTVALPLPTLKTVDLPAPTLKTVALSSPTLKTVDLPSTTLKTVALPLPKLKTVDLPSTKLKTVALSSPTLKTASFPSPPIDKFDKLSK